jgi:hypothetical protein
MANLGDGPWRRASFNTMAKKDKVSPREIHAAAIKAGALAFQYGASYMDNPYNGPNRNRDLRISWWRGWMEEKACLEEKARAPSEQARQCLPAHNVVVLHEGMQGSAASGPHGGAVQSGVNTDRWTVAVGFRIGARNPATKL